MEQLTRVFAKEVGARHINVNSISPDPTDTELPAPASLQLVVVFDHQQP
ncbi:hypothetical protein GCM10027275_50710 [Rhabdobacter roseus]|uniref:NAD(P)-dependent dehydrogenase (Short-subunit alcohol dehydrogenase family) n=1 Tax=Rhabdobacter roseus TaxID=1655419 RepID=A0A840TV69_9BACT|nr:NAD(P)-dependent dehydrogenase (short-subunit alcohol dehydrogenase family) [Rhabdobacter roseus]